METGPSPPPPRALAIVGPTASGKTGLAIEVARALDGEIVSLDSRQAYRGFGVGTAAPSAEERARVPHHGVGFLEPDETLGAGRFARLAHAWIHEIEARGRVPILAGGTGLFLRALTHPMFREPRGDPAARRRLVERLEWLETAELRRWAERLDPLLAGRSEPLDRQRALRTVELTLRTGRPLGWWMRHGEPERDPLAVSVFLIEPEASALRSRIRARAHAMLESGAWEAEVRILIDRGLESSRAFDALGYAEVARLVRGRIDRAETLERIVASTWAYARRQRTWFRHQLPAGAVRLDASEPVEQLARRVVAGWRAAIDRAGGHETKDGSG